MYLPELWGNHQRVREGSGAGQAHRALAENCVPLQKGKIYGQGQTHVAYSNRHGCSMRRDGFRATTAHERETDRRVQRPLQRHPAVQRRMLLRLYQRSNARILRFRSAISKSFEFDIQLNLCRLRRTDKRIGAEGSLSTGLLLKGHYWIISCGKAIYGHTLLLQRLGRTKARDL